MNLAVSFGARSLVSLGASYGDVAALVQHGRLVANWLRTRQVDAELFESISEVFGEVLRRRGLVDGIMMNNRWSSQWHFVHKGKMVNHTEVDKVSTSGELPAFSWLFVSLITAVDLCLSTSEIRKLLAEVFVEILNRDDLSDLSEALNIQLNTNIESWRSSGCIRGLVVPVQSAMRNCYLRLTGSKSIPQLTPAEGRELSSLLVWLLAGRSSEFHALSAICCAVFAGLRSAGIQVDVDEGDGNCDIGGGRPVVHYSINKELETGLSNILDSEFLAAGFSTQIPPQKATFMAGDPSEMIEGFRRPNKIKNRMALCWDKGAAAGQKVRLEVCGGIAFENRLAYRIESFDEPRSRWPKEVYYLVDHACPAPTQSLCAAMDDLFGEDVGKLYSWLRLNMDGDEMDEGEGEETILQSKVMDVSRNFPEEELDRFLGYQALVYGFWYAMLEQLISTEYLKQDVYLSTLWGWRDHRLLSALQPIARSMRPLSGTGSGGVGRSALLQLFGLMFAARRERDLRIMRELVAIVGPISVVSMSLLKTSDKRDNVARFAIIAMPILDLLPEQNGELYAVDPHHGLRLEPPGLPYAVTATPAVRDWSIHTQMKFEDGEIEGVSMVARCDGRLVATFSSALADLAIVKAQVQQKSVKDSDSASQASMSATDASFRAHEITEELLLKGIMPSGSRHGAPFVIQSKGNVSMRYLAAALCGYSDPVLLEENQSLPWALKRVKTTRDWDSHIIC